MSRTGSHKVRVGVRANVGVRVWWARVTVIQHLALTEKMLQRGRSHSLC